MFKKRLFATSQILGILLWATFIILTVYIPIFVQAVYGGSETDAGFILMPLMLGVCCGSAIGGIFNQNKLPNFMLVSIISFFAGMFLLGTLTPETNRSFLTIYMIIAGFGVGFSFSLLPTLSLMI